MNQATVLKTREGLTKYREILMKAYGNGKNVKMHEALAECKLFPMIGTFLINVGVVKEYNIVGETGPGLGRRLQWSYKGNVDGVVDGELVSKMINMYQNYERNRKANKKAEKQAQQQTIKLPAKTHEKSKATVDSVLLWINEQLEKENTMQGYLRPIEKVMYGEIQQVLNNVKMSIEPLKKAIEEFNI